MFLYIIRKIASNKAVQEKFHHFRDIIFHVFYEVLNFLIHLYMKIVNLLIKNNALHQQITENNKYFLYFQDYLKVLDSAYIPVNILSINRVVYQNRKNILLQNILRIYIIDLQFYYILASWERSVHNNRILEDAFITILTFLPLFYYLSNFLNLIFLSYITLIELAQSLDCI